MIDLSLGQQSALVLTWDLALGYAVNTNGNDYVFWTLDGSDIRFVSADQLVLKLL